MPPVTLQPVALRVKDAAAFTALSEDALRALVNTGKLTAVENGLRGKARRYRLLTAELRVLATQGLAALREFRARMRRG